MKRYLLLTSLAILIDCGVMLFAQLPSKCSAYKPAELYSVVLKESTIDKFVRSGSYGQNVKPKNLDYWKVFSDRDENITYADPSTTKPYGKLSFNEEVRIAKISGEFAMVFSEPNKTVIYPEISGSAVFKGWIPMKTFFCGLPVLPMTAGYISRLFCVSMLTSVTPRLSVSVTEVPRIGPRL